MADGRSQLDIATYANFFHWTNQQIETQLRFLAKAPLLYSEFGLLPRKSAKSLTDELRFAALHLQKASRSISAQLRAHRAFEAALWVTRGTVLEQILEGVEKTYGPSLWLLEATLATKQYIFGLEGQKRFVEQVRSAAKHTLAAYYSYHLGVRNEPNATPSRFADDFERKLKRTKFSPPVRIYLLYKIAGLFPTNEDRLADLLMVGHGSAIIDLYETFIAVCQEIISKRLKAEIGQVLFEVIEPLSRSIDDFRLRQMIFILRGRQVLSESKKIPTPMSTDYLLRGLVKDALRVAYRSFRAPESNSNELITIGVLLALSPQEAVVRRSKRLMSQQARNVSKVLLKGEEYDQAYAEVQKSNSNWSFLPSVKALNAFVHWGTPYVDNSQSNAWRNRRVLNSAFDDPRSILGLFEFMPFEIPSLLQLEDKHRASLTASFLAVLADREYKVPVEFDPRLAAMLAILRKVSDPGFACITALWTEIKKSDLPEFLSNHCATCLLERVLSDAEYGLAAEIIVDLALLKGFSPSVLPLRELASNDSWRRLRAYAANIAIPIVIDLIWRVTRDDKDSTARRFAVQKFLMANSTSMPSELVQERDKIPRERLLYFLDSVCSPTVLDMLPMLSSSQLVEDERLNICRVLSEIDPGNSDQYHDEILVSEHQRVVRSGLRVVDSSRIHVDQDAITFWATNELGETFRRYRDLVKAGVGVADNYDSLLRGVLKADELNKAYFEIPNSEADDILFQMVSQLSDRFINDSNSGLDSYLSKRVRHESLTSYLRNPLERHGLITQIDSKTGQYETNIRWTASRLKVSVETGLLIDECLREFSENYDRILLSLRADYFHIRSKDKPLGLFEFSLTAPMLHLLRSVVQQRLEVDDFALTCLTLFWITLNPSLERARNLLRIDIKARVAGEFEQLRAKLYPLVSEFSAVAELSATIASTSGAVQMEIDNVAEWFVRQEVSQGMHRYTLEQAVEISAESALRGMRNFEPEIHIDSTGDSLIAAGELIVIADVMRVALGNVKAHSRKTKGRPKVDIHVTESTEQEIISFKVISDIGQHVRCEESERRLDEIRNDIAARTYAGKVRSEGGSGLRKLASIVHQSDRGRISFGFQSEEKFILEVNLSFFVASSIEAAA